MSTNKLLCFTGGTCGAVPGIDHGFMESTTSVLTQGSVTYRCFQGFTLSGYAKINCLTSRQWDSRPICYGKHSVNILKAHAIRLNLSLLYINTNTRLLFTITYYF